jgi:hypothetical protein
MPSKSARFETMIVRRVLSQQSKTVAGIHEAYRDPSQKRAFLEQTTGEPTRRVIASGKGFGPHREKQI